MINVTFIGIRCFECFNFANDNLFYKLHCSILKCIQQINLLLWAIPLDWCLITASFNLLRFKAICAISYEWYAIQHACFSRFLPNQFRLPFTSGSIEKKGEKFLTDSTFIYKMKYSKYPFHVKWVIFLLILQNDKKESFCKNYNYNQFPFILFLIYIFHAAFHVLISINFIFFLIFLNLIFIPKKYFF